MASESDDILAETSLLDFKRIMRGLASSKESGEYKFAKMAITRIFGPSSISLLVCLMVLGTLFTLVARKTITQSSTVEVTMMEMETVELDDIKDLIKEIEIAPIDPPDASVNFSDVPMLAPPSESPVVSEQTVELSAPVPVLTKSPLIIRNLYGNRMSAAARQGALKAGGGSKNGEDAVLRALRWLKKKQDSDGSWKTASDVDPTAMTGLALLTFLAHGETPQSEEFGATVEKAIKHLIDVQSKSPNGKFSQNSYTHAICAYSMSEAYALTKIMSVRDSMEKAIAFLIAGQQPEGGYDYNYAMSKRFDTSVAGWNFQALKAATMAGSTHSNLQLAVERAIKNLKTEAFAQDGSGFVYSGVPGKPTAKGGTRSMTAVGTLCLQLLGRPKDAETRQGLTLMEPYTCVWPTGKDAKPSLYLWYYVTQCKFQNSEASFNAWNDQFNKQFVDAQIREPDGCGYWPRGDHGGAVYATTLATLTLEVYYRYLPTYKKTTETETATAASSDDIKVEIL
ncbi:MAG: prenyltransferase/squalene oxidase repeat-containing protein [Kiritimatiellia bacterium]